MVYAMLRGPHLACALCWFFLALVPFAFSQFTPPAIPLAVRSPYFSTWFGSVNGTPFTNTWPHFWSQVNEHNNGWAGFIRVDGNTYRWLGAAAGMNATNLTNSQITPTRTIWTIQAGPMDLTVTFLTPIEPSDWVRQSIPFSYLFLEANSTDGQTHDVQVYSDVSAEWLSGNISQIAQWNTTKTSQVVYHQVELQQPTPFTEVDDQAVDGTLYHAMLLGTSATYETGRDIDVRGQFSTSGTLDDSQDSDFRAISNDYPVFAIAVDLGKIQSTQSPVVWSVGFVRDPSIQYTTGSGNIQNRSPYYVTQYDSVVDAMTAFLNDFDDAQARSVQLDKEIMQNATAISSEYSDLVSLAARQTFGGIDITVSQGSDAQWNTSDIMIFMKNMGTDRRVNPVEIMYAAFPMFLYINASYGKPLLAPLLEFQSSAAYTLSYAAPDLGSSYPIASGNTASSQTGVEDTADMLIMMLAHARASGDGSLLKQYYGLLNSWAEYLVQNSETPTNQVTADGQSTANMTNLAIKGIIAIQAMSQISAVISNSNDTQSFANTAATDASVWASLALSSNQNQGLLFSYGDQDSWALMYNLYADRLLETDVVGQSIYDRQGDYYAELISDGTSRTYGLPLDSAAAVQGNSAWLSFTAATTNSSVRDDFISMIWQRASYNLTAGVFPAMYEVDSGTITGGIASPAQGAMFALLALDVANQTIKIPPDNAAGKSTEVGAVVGGVVGGVAGLVILVFAGFCFWRRRKTRPQKDEYEKTEVEDSPATTVPFPYNSTPLVPVRAVPVSDSGVTMNDLEQEPRVMSTKLREHLQSTTEQMPPAPSSSGSGSRYSQDPPTSIGSPSARSEIHGLRTEVENLRRYMEQLQVQPMEAPPSYDEE